MVKLSKPVVTRIGQMDFVWGKRTYVMGIINMSPESFSGDGITDIEVAVAQAKRFVSDGADILDIGGESTRPGLPEISESEELNRVLPFIRKISRELAAPVSVDTCRYNVALAAIQAGAAMINDQWGLKKEPLLADLAAHYRVPIILMSNQRDIGSYDAGADRDTAGYKDVMAVVKSNLRESVTRAVAAGVPDNNIILDPGIGFGRSWQQDLEIIRRLAELRIFGRPLLLGTSRKSFIKMVLNLPVADRIEGTAATVAIGIANGADIVRVHDVKQMVRVCRMADAIVR